MKFSIHPSSVHKRSPLLCLLLACMCIAGGSALRAQTAHFAGMVRTLGGAGPLHPVGVAVDRSGDVFIADATDNAVKEMVAVNGSIPTSPTVLTVGSGFNHPEGVAVDGNGNVFVADQFNNAVKQIVAGTGGAAAGTVSSASTVKSLGSGFNHPEGVAVDGSGNVFVADLGNNAIKEMVAVGGSIPASPTIKTVGSGFSQPTGVAVDAKGNVFVADTLNNVVKQIVAGTGGAAAGTVNSSSTVNILGNGFAEPDGVAVDSSGDVFVADFNNNAVKEIVAINGVISASPTINSLGAGFNLPNGVTVDASGNVFVADYNQDAVLEIGAANFSTLAVGTTSAQQTLTFNFDTSGTLFHTPFVVLTMGAPNLDFQAATTQPSTVCVSGHTYYAGDTCTVDSTFAPTHFGQRLGAVQLMGSSGLPIATGYLGGVGTGPQVIFPSNNTPISLGSGFSSPADVAVDGSGNVFLADAGNGHVKEMMAVNGSIPATPVIRSLGSGFGPIDGIAVDGSGNVFVADINNNAVKEIVAVDGSIPDSPVIRTLGSGFNSPFGVAVDGSGDVFVAGNADMKVTEIVAVNGSIPASPTLRVLGSGFNYPLGVAVDAYGNVFVGDWGNKALKEIVAVNGTIPASPTIRTWTGGFMVPLGIAVDPLGNVFIADAYDNAVEEMLAVNGSLPASPVIVTLGGGFAYPTGVVVDPIGNVFVADFDNNAVKELPYATAPSLSFASTPTGSTSSDSPQIVALANDGNADLSFAVPAAGLNPSLSNTNFVLDGGSTCPQLDTSSSTVTLAAGAFCTYQVSFSPTTAGSSITGALSIADNNLNASPSTTQTIALNGSATGSANAVAPGAPMIGSATASNGQAMVSFTPPSSDGGATITSYTATSNPGGIIGICAFSPCIVLGLTNGTAYSFTVTATNSVGTGAASASSNSVTPTASQTITFNNPGTQNFGTSPTLVATASSGLAVTFSSSTMGVCTITNAGTLTTIAAGSCTINANQAGNAAYAAAPQVSQSFSIAAVAPGAPMIGSATGSNAQATVSFTPPSSTGGATITSYTATSYPGGMTGTCASSPCIVTGLTNGTAYSFTVTATNSAGTGAASFQTVAITPQGTQTITFPQPGTPMIYGAVPMTLAATASSGLAVSYTVTGPAILTGSVVSFTGAGTVTVTASQPGDASYSPATPVSHTVLVNPASLTVTAANALRSYGADTPAFTGTYTGNVNGDSFTVSGTTPATATSPPGTYPITPTAAGTNLASYTTSYVNGVLTVTRAATAVALSPSSSAISAGEGLTLMATVTTANAPVSSGMVIFYCGVTSMGASALDAQGVAILTTTTLPVGSDVITATYAATSDYAGSTSSPQVVTVASTGVVPAATTTSLTISSNAITAGQSLTLAATVLAGAAPVSSGMVTFYNATTSIGATALNAQGVATLTATTLPVGSNAITATYAATTNYAGSTSSAQIVTVAATTLLPTATTTSLTISSSAITAGQSLTLAATVLAGAEPVNSGTVTFYNGTTSLGASTLTSQGLAILTSTTLPVGTDTLVATYAATSGYAGSTSSAQLVTVASSVPAIPVPSYSLTASPASLTIARGQSGATLLTITPAGGFTGTLTLSCGNLPSFATCAFAQNSIALTGNDQPVQVSLTLATDVQQPQLAASRAPAPLNPLLPAMVFLLPAGWQASRSETSGNARPGCGAGCNSAFCWRPLELWRLGSRAAILGIPGRRLSVRQM